MTVCKGIYSSYNRKTNPIIELKLTCPHCGYTGQKGNLIKWHFDKCKVLTNKPGYYWEAKSNKVGKK